MKLHIETTGHGPDIVLIHGWGVHGGIWNPFVPVLAQQYRVTRVDLPGHGYSRDVPMPTTLAELACLVAAVTRKNAAWLGWSLGGLICLRAALDFPDSLRTLTLAGTTPRFMAAADWPHAMPLAQLREFAMQLGRDYRQTIQRFLTLQMRGDEAARVVLRQLRATLFARGEPDPASLVAGLEILRNSDLRTELAHIRLPTLVVAGEYDRLVPPQASRSLAAAIPGAKYVLFPRTAHAPFLSRPADFHQLLTQFLTGASSARTEPI